MVNEVIWNRPDKPEATLVLSHGAGAPMDSEFMEEMAVMLSQRGVAVMRFEFPYMRRRRETGKKSPPDRAPKLLEAFRQALDQAGDPARLFIGGKSMGGRMASMLATEIPVRGVVCLGYPFHPPGKPERTRLNHLPDLKAPMLVCQGERDALGSAADVAGYDLPEGIGFCWLPDGDHSLKPRKRSGTTLEANLARAADAVADFCLSRSGGQPGESGNSCVAKALGATSPEESRGGA